MATMTHPIEYADFVEKYSDEYGVDKYLVYALISVESSYRTDAVSDAGAIGLTQITEETFRWLKMNLEPNSDTQFADLYDPEVSIRYGTYYIHRCMERYDNDVSTRAAAYHSGWGLVDSLLAERGENTLTEFPYSRMNNYVKKINNAYSAYLYKYSE